jgi:large subunit ribosomal protein L25
MPSSPIELNAEPRTVFGKHVRQLRRKGITPANIFGHGESHAFQAPARTFEHLLAHGGRTNLVAIALDGDTPTTALLKGYQRDPKTAELLHLDFQAVSLTETVSTSIPLRFVGESPAVTHGGVMTHPLGALRIEARASEIPDFIEVDISVLAEMNSAIHVSDLNPPTGVRLLDPPEEIVAAVQPPKVEVEELEAAEEAAEAQAEVGTESAEAAADAEGTPEASTENATE